MDLMLSGKSVFVAAASKGLGKAVALQYAKEGARVTIASRSLEQLAQAREEIRAETGIEPALIKMDVTNAEDIRNAIRTAAASSDGLDVLVTNAGGPPGGFFSDMKDEDWAGGFELSLMSAIRMIREALPFMKAAGAEGSLTWRLPPSSSRSTGLFSLTSSGRELTPWRKVWHRNWPGTAF